MEMLEHRLGKLFRGGLADDRLQGIDIAARLRPGEWNMEKQHDGEHCTSERSNKPHNQGMRKPRSCLFLLQPLTHSWQNRRIVRSRWAFRHMSSKMGEHIPERLHFLSALTACPEMGFNTLQQLGAQMAVHIIWKKIFNVFRGHA